MLELLRRAVEARVSIVISGGTGSGKTTLLNILSSFVSTNERIVTIEDSAELMMRQRHVVRLETRPPNVEGHGVVRQRELLINALRMRPDRIVLGEVRGEEALDMLQAMNTGHDGSLTTVHANSARDALSRIETMAMLGDHRLPERAIRAQIASAVQLVVQIARLSDGSRRITCISEVAGYHSEAITMNDLFVFERKGLGQDGKAKGQFRSTGIIPHFNEKLVACGMSLPEDMLDHLFEV
jgi:pilus assembly protein CpaF